MSCRIPVHCRHCGEELDVFVPFEDQFCSEECYKDELLKPFIKSLQQAVEFAKCNHQFSKIERKLVNHIVHVTAICSKCKCQVIEFVKPGKLSEIEIENK